MMVTLTVFHGGANFGFFRQFRCFFRAKKLFQERFSQNCNEAPGRNGSRRAARPRALISACNRDARGGRNAITQPRAGAASTRG